MKRRYNATTNVDTHLRYQIVLLADRGHTVFQTSRLVLRSHAMVLCVLKWFRGSGLDAVSCRYTPSRVRMVTPHVGSHVAGRDRARPTRGRWASAN